MKFTSRLRILILLISTLGLWVCGVMLFTTAHALTVGPTLTKTFPAPGASGLPPMNTAYLTRDSNDTFKFSTFGTRMFMQAPPSNVGENTRQVVWPTTTNPTLNQQSCATWLGASSYFVQEGIALRITNAGGVTHAITVTKNIVYGVQWAFNIHYWDSSNTGSEAVGLGQWDMSKVVLNEIGNYQYMPWRVCFRAVNNVVSMKIWFPAQMKEPTWSDPNYTRSLTIPAAYSTPGYAGWYIGHIQPSNDAEYNGMETWSIP